MSRAEAEGLTRRGGKTEDAKSDDMYADLLNFRIFQQMQDKLRQALPRGVCRLGTLPLAEYTEGSERHCLQLLTRDAVGSLISGESHASILSACRCEQIKLVYGGDKPNLDM